MDAVKFLKERKRMCRSCKCCEGCRISELSDGSGCINVDYESQVKIVEEWGRKHPIKTRMSEFLEKHPNALLDSKDGLPHALPCVLDASIKEELCKDHLSCSECRRKYWREEIISDVVDKALERDSFHFSQGHFAENDGKKVYVCDRNKYKSLESVDENAVYFVVHTTPEETEKE